MSRAPADRTTPMISSSVSRCWVIVALQNRPSRASRLGSDRISRAKVAEWTDP